MTEPMICRWIFPPADFPAWRELVSDTDLASHADYLALVAAVQADQERAGRTVQRIKMTVAEMAAALAESGWPNTPEYRAAVFALRGSAEAPPDCRSGNCAP
jgi:hypothetical protein